MAGQIQLRQGTTTEHDTFTGAVGELTYDTEKKQLRVHDGSTVGGKVVDDPTPQATETVLGVAKIATTSIAQVGVNDTDFITAKKLSDFNSIQSQKRKWVNVSSQRVANTWYQNTTLFDVDVCISAYTGNTNNNITIRPIGSSETIVIPMSYVGNNLNSTSFGYVVIPHGWEYRATSLTTWSELRV